MSKILWFSSLLEGNLPSSKDKNQSFLLNQALLHFDFHFISQIEECQIDSHVEKTDWSDRESGQIDRSIGININKLIYQLAYWASSSSYQSYIKLFFGHTVSLSSSGKIVRNQPPIYFRTLNFKYDTVNEYFMILKLQYCFGIQSHLVFEI